jgi:hypothetical protein
MEEQRRDHEPRDGTMTRETQLRRRIRLLTWLFICSLVVSGLTAIPLETEFNVAARMLGVERISLDETESGFAKWLLIVRTAIHQTNAEFPFMAYGTDWLAFGHFVIAVAFVGALRDPARNIWLFPFGMIACVLVVPCALVMGGLRGIPIYWRLIDCSFGVFGIIPLFVCYRWTKQLSQVNDPGGKVVR